MVLISSSLDLKIWFYTFFSLLKINFSHGNSCIENRTKTWTYPVFLDNLALKNYTCDINFRIFQMLYVTKNKFTNLFFFVKSNFIRTAFHHHHHFVIDIWKTGGKNFNCYVFEWCDRYSVNLWIDILYAKREVWLFFRENSVLFDF